MANKKSVNVDNSEKIGKFARTRPRGKARLGQNFLVDEGASERVVAALGDTAGAAIIEIGCGRGALTDLLAKRATRLIGIEFDRVLAAQLRMRYRQRSNVEIIEADVLTVDFENLIRRHPAPLLAGPLSRNAEDMAKAKLAGNLPYYITADILLRLFSYSTLFELFVIMVQREVADRIAAKPGTRDYGLLSATSQLFCRVEKLFTLPPQAFSPPPKVHSTVLKMTVAPQAEALGVEPEKFIEFLKRSFAQKRKTLVNNLKTFYGDGDIRRALKGLKVRADVRAEALTLRQSADILRTLEPG